MRTIESFKELVELEFTNQVYVTKKELQAAFNTISPDSTEQALRRALYSLKTEKVLVSIGAGLFVHGSSQRSIYKPQLSTNATDISSVVTIGFPYTESLIWETRQLYEFLVHQPAQNIIILEVEKESSEAVFLQLKNGSNYDFVYEIDNKTFSRYFADQVNLVLVKPAITQQPTQKIEGTRTARLEKILVDLFVDREIFSNFQGSELVKIYENAYERYWINPKILYRYANRRKSGDKIREFLRNLTNVEEKYFRELPA